MNIHSLFNITLLLALLSFPLLIEYNKRVLKGKSKTYNQLLKNIRLVHPYAGIILIVSGAIHGYNKLGGKLRFHTGSLVLIALIINALIGYYYKRSKHRAFSTLHRGVGVIIVIAFLVHYFNPWLFY